MKKPAVFISALALLATSLFGIDSYTASAGDPDYISPYFSAYISDETQGKIVAQDNVFDMSAYTSNLSGKFPVTTEYTLENVQKNAEFCYPVLGTIDNLADVKISINGTPLQTEILYGNTPYYYAGENVGPVTVQDAIASAKPTEIADEIGVLYTFETSDTALEYSFSKTEEQTVIHSGKNSATIGRGNYAIRFDNNTYPYRLFVIGGDLQNLTANVLYTREEVTCKAYADSYLDEMIAELGEQYRGVCYSRFNRSMDGSFHDVSDVLYHFDHYSFALVKTTLPAGTVNVTVNSYIAPLVNALYKPTVYVIRSVSPYPLQYATTTRIKLSEALPYIIESNVKIENNVITAEQTKDDFYYVVRSEKKSEDILASGNRENQKREIVLWVCVGVGTVASGVLTFSIIMIRKKNKR